MCNLQFQFFSLNSSTRDVPGARMTEQTVEQRSIMQEVAAATKSTKKCHLSLSFNFDFNEVSSDQSSDSEATDLQIDISEIHNYETASKKKNDIEETSFIINDMEEEIERQLDTKAAKTNLTVTNVKNILKHVITNEHVMTMIKNRLQDTEDDVPFEPKLTRAKAKELAAAQINIPWPITPVKKTSTQVQALIEGELPEDSSDEEYNPEQDKQSDTERESNSANCDVQSEPSTPASNWDFTSNEQTKLPEVQFDPEGIFKVPGIPEFSHGEDSIGQRTRSKLCLSETPLEQIEQAFIPPDITTDMYDFDCDVDEDWDNFLKEFTQPLTQDHIIDDDPEADPEYNILEDEETDLLDKEELRADKAVKITRKELNTLIAELFEFTDTISKEEQENSKKRRSLESANSLSENNTTNCSATNLLPLYKEPALSNLITLEQRQLLSVQLRQHIQLMAQHFVMTYMHPTLHTIAKTCKENLNSIKYLNNSPCSIFNAVNLPDALELLADWEKKFSDEKFAGDYKKTLEYPSSKCKYVAKFHGEMRELFLESKALMYPQLLPLVPFKNEMNKITRSSYLKSEENLIAIGLEQFLPFVSSRSRKFKGKKVDLMDAVQLIIEYLIPSREPRALLIYIQKRRAAKDINPIKHYFESGSAPRTIHYITLECNIQAPKDQPVNLLPPEWQNGLDKKNDMLVNQRRNYFPTLVTDPRILGVNSLPKILPATAKKKAITNNSSPAENEANLKAFKTVVNKKRCNSTVINKNNPPHCDKSVEKGTAVSDKDKINMPTKLANAPENTNLMVEIYKVKDNESNNNIAKQSEKRLLNKQLEKMDNEKKFEEKEHNLGDFQIIKRILEPMHPLLHEDEWRSNFFLSYLQKLHQTLESSNNEETFWSVIKLYLNYNEKLNSIVTIEKELSFSETLEPLKNETIKEKTEGVKDAVTINLYQDVCSKLREYPELCTDFLLFLKPHQAAIMNKYMEYIMLHKMCEFVDVAQVYLGKQPWKIRRIIQEIARLSSDPQITVERIRVNMNSILNEYPSVMELFLQVLPTARPPEGLLGLNLFENLSCYIAKKEDNCAENEGFYEYIELPVLGTQENSHIESARNNCSKSKKPSKKVSHMKQRKTEEKRFVKSRQTINFTLKSVERKRNLKKRPCEAKDLQKKTKRRKLTKGEEKSNLEAGCSSKEGQKNTEVSERNLKSLNNKSWTRQEDTVLLETIKKEYSEDSLKKISKMLGDRTIDEVKERCNTLLSLLQKMM